MISEQSLGQGKLLKDVDKSLGSDKDMRDAARAGDQTKLDDAASKFFDGLTKGDVSKSMNVDSVFGGDPNDPIMQAQLRAIANKRQDLIPSILAKGNGKTGKNIQEPYRKILDEVVTRRVKETLDSGEFKQQIADIQNDFDAQIDAAKTNADSLDAVKGLSTEKERAEEQLKNDRVGFVADPVVAQRKYDSTMKDIDDRRTKIINDYIASLEKQRDAKKESIEADVKKDVEKKYGKKAFEQAVANNTFGVAPENTAAPKETPVEPPKPNK